MQTVIMIVGTIGAAAGVAGALFAFLAWKQAVKSSVIARQSLEVSKSSKELASESLEISKQQAALSPRFRVALDYERELGTTNALLSVRIMNVGTLPARNIEATLELPAGAIGSYIDYYPGQPRIAAFKDDDAIYAINEYDEDFRYISGSCSLRNNGYGGVEHLSATMSLIGSIGIDDWQTFKMPISIIRPGTFEVHIKIVSDEGRHVDGKMDFVVP